MASTTQSRPAADGRDSRRHFSTQVDLPTEALERLVDLLNQFLADTSDLRSQFNQAHWNVKGPQFYSLHLLFDAIAGELLEYSDEIAERATALGGYARGTNRMSAQASRLLEYPVEATEGMEHVAALVERMGAYANAVRHAIDESTEIGDPSTADLLTEISRGVDKRLWFLEAHLQGREDEAVR